MTDTLREIVVTPEICSVLVGECLRVVGVEFKSKGFIIRVTLKTLKDQTTICEGYDQWSA